MSKLTPTTAFPGCERRALHDRVELRAADGDKPVVRGYAAKFNTRSDDLGGFVEVIAPGAFDQALGSDVRALINHDPSLILARSRDGTGTLRLFVDDAGLGYEFAPDMEQSYARDLVRALARGDVDQSSFAFSIADGGEEWSEREGITVRTITKVARLYDVSPVTYPAYPDASVALRGLEQFRQAQQPAPATQPTEQKPIPVSGAVAARLGI
jgi:uncharacterized protein